MSCLWSHRFASLTQRITSSAIRDLLKLTQIPGMISFAGGNPAPELFPAARMEQACDALLESRKLSDVALQYGPTEGYLPLREMISELTHEEDVPTHPSNILVTSGSQQALDLLGKLLINPGDRVLVEGPTYLGALQAFSAYGAEYVSVPTDEHGMRSDLLEEGLRAGPKFIYMMPNFQNPTGVSLSLRRRREIIALAERYGIPIVEDDPYGQLRYEGAAIPSLLSVERRSKAVQLAHDTSDYRVGNVIHLSSFSKVLAPGLRLGWMVAPANVVQKLVSLKQGTDLHTASFNQMLVHEVCRDGFLPAHVRRLRREYKKRRDVMLDALQQSLPPELGITWSRPHGGLFIWVKLPAHINVQDLLKAALDKKVAFVPGAYFFGSAMSAAETNRYIRLNFSNATPELIQEGVARLVTCIKQQ